MLVEGHFVPRWPADACCVGQQFDMNCNVKVVGHSDDAPHRGMMPRWMILSKGSGYFAEVCWTCSSCWTHGTMQ